MVFDIRDPFPSQPLFVAPGEVERFPNGRDIHAFNDDEGSSQMGDEGCPNESQSVNDATGYSNEEGKKGETLSRTFGP